jgi:hypothetical protein
LVSVIVAVDSLLLEKAASSLLALTVAVFVSVPAVLGAVPMMWIEIAGALLAMSRLGVRVIVWLPAAPLRIKLPLGLPPAAVAQVTLSL